MGYFCNQMAQFPKVFDETLGERKGDGAGSVAQPSAET
jgi:hypothetical protein